MRIILNIICVCLLLATYGCGTNIEQKINEAEATLQSAPDSAEVILNGITSIDNPKDFQKAKCCLLISEAKLKQGKSFLMVDGFDDALDYYEASRDTSALLDMYQLAAIKMRWLGCQDSASIFLRKAIDIASNVTTPTKSELLIELSNLYAMPSL